MGDYIYIGYDIRVDPKYSAISADANVWLQDEDAYEQAISAPGVEENFFQLLNPINKTELDELCCLVNNEFGESVLILFALEESIYKSVKKVAPCIEPVFTGGISFSLIGFDICDIDGFFSIFYMDKANLNRKNLLGNKEIGEAASIINAANDLIPVHAPFHLVKLCKVQGCD